MKFNFWKKFYRILIAVGDRNNSWIIRAKFAQIAGSARLYQNMPWKLKKQFLTFPLMDSQVNLEVKDYYSDDSFCRNDMGNINLWKLFNLFSGANKMNYIDLFLDRRVDCQQFVNGLYQAIGENKYHWFVS